MAKGRPSILESRGLTIEDIIRTFEETGTAIQTARELDIDEKTVRKYLRSSGVHLRTGPPKGTKYKRVKKAQLDRWVEQNPETVLPRSSREIASLTGISQDAVAGKLKRRRKEFTRRIGALPDLRKTPLVVKKKGTPYPARKWKSYVLRGDALNGVVTVIAQVSGKEILFRVPLRHIETILDQSERNQS